MVSFQVTHRTEYRYPSMVSSSFGELVLLPREHTGQSCPRSELRIEPRPQDLRERVDFFGNRATYFAVLAPHTRLTVTATSVVRTGGAALPPEAGSPGTGWRQARDRVRAAAGVGPAADPVALEARQFVLGSPLVEPSAELANYASASFGPGVAVLDGARHLAGRIYRDFRYLPGVTQVTSTIAEVLAQRAGVCQDFAHLAVGCLRSIGLPARYVSGYLETEPPPGQERLTGVDASHAWFSVFVPDPQGGGVWVDVDPTNDQLTDERYITIGWGRDYTDVPPLKGVIFTRGVHQDLRVSVDVTRLPT